MEWNTLFESKLTQYIEPVRREILKYEDILINHTIDLFYILIVGYIVSLIVFISESLISKTNCTNKTNLDPIKIFIYKPHVRGTLKITMYKFNI